MNRKLGRLSLLVAATSFFLLASPNPTLAQTAPQTPLFNPQTEYGAGSKNGPSGIVVSDFNGDGKPDLAVVNFGDWTAWVLLGNGDGTFQPAKNIYFASGGGFPWYIAEGDFNGDGKPDLVITNYGDNSVSVLLGNGDGTFQAARTFPVGIHPGLVAVGDFNGDRKPDLVVSNVDSSTVSVLLGNGDGTFLPALNFPAGPNPWYFAVGDFNLDGKLDLAVADYGCSLDCSVSPSNSVSLLLGNGDGTFQPASQLTVGNGPAGVAVGDFNGDGKPDLAVANVNENTFSVLLGNGDGTFQAAKTFSSVGSHPYFVAVGDFNRDGKPDLVITNHLDTTVSVLLGNGDGTFQPVQTFPVDSDPVYVTVGDLNGDGVQDLAVANLHTIAISVLPGNAGTGVPPILSGLSLNPSSVTGGSPSTGTVTLSGPAPSGGAVVSLSSSNTGVASVPSSVTVPAGATSASFTVTTTAVSTSTSVTISGSYGGATQTATLTVNPGAVPPSITSQPASQTVTAGQSTTFSVTASGTAPLSYQWSKNGTPISGANSSSYTTPPTTTSDNGAQFVVVVSNTAGSATSNPATLTVNPAPVATPSFSPGGGTYTGSVTVSISDATSGATIHYTTDGSTPTTSSPVYSSALTFNQTTTLKAMAAASGMTDSGVASATYTIQQQQVATPSFSPGGGTYTGSVTVTISDATSGATIHYTTDGSTPTTASAVYSTALTFNQTTTLKAMAAASGMTDSAVASATYTIQQSFSLTVSKTDLGGGTVTSSPAGINCGGTCSASYVSGTTVTLTATPDLLSGFGGWSGCDSVSGNTCTVEMTSARSVTADFRLLGIL